MSVCVVLYFFCFFCIFTGDVTLSGEHDGFLFGLGLTRWRAAKSSRLPATAWRGRALRPNRKEQKRRNGETAVQGCRVGGG